MRYVNQSSSFGGPSARFQVTHWVRILLIANALVFLVGLAVGRDLIIDLFAFSPGRLADRPWGMVTYMFVHAGLWHLLMNLLFVFFFGPPLEERWGSDMFIKFYLVCGLGGVLLSFAFSGAAIVGASAACYGLMLAFALAWPEQPVYIWGMFPVRVKWLVGFLVALSFASAIGPSRDGVAHLAHLGGAVAGFLLVKSGWMPSYGGGYGAMGQGGAAGWGDGRRGGRGGAGRSGRAGTRGRGWPGRRRSGRSGSSRWGAGPRGSSRGGASRGGKAGAPRRGRPSRRGRDKRDETAGSGRIAAAFEERRARQRAARERAELDQVDAVLDKISAKGIESLTAEERELLDRVSRQTKAN
ncbi:MAG: rhomboid family intramembrane serine protease [Gemmatimonadetes bacterium]|nr:rhomboid family intramembrane serine protease [Gemmatimonadota bacterium]